MSEVVNFGQLGLSVNRILLQRLSISFKSTQLPVLRSDFDSVVTWFTIIGLKQPSKNSVAVVSGLVDVLLVKVTEIHMFVCAKFILVIADRPCKRN